MKNLPTNWLKPLPLAGGSKSLPCRILPGPMEGITDGSFCRVMAARGLIPAWITPFIRISTAVPRPARLRARLAPFGLGDKSSDLRPQASDLRLLPVIVQLMGTDIPLLAETAKQLAMLGTVAGIDLNCACPSKVVVANGAGGAMLRTPHWIRDALCELRRAAPGLGMSVKLRGGFADSARELPAIVAAVREARPDFVMMHFRTVQEEYRAVPEGWKRLARAKELLGDGIPLLGAGDVFSAAAALEMWRQTGVDGVTPARGILRNPWLLREIEEMCGGARSLEHGAGKAEHRTSNIEHRTSSGNRTDRSDPANDAKQPERADFLRELVAASAEAGEWRQGFVLELARNLFGVESAIFAQLARAKSPEAMLTVLGAR